MSQQTQPNPVALFEGASSRMAQLLVGVKNDQLNSPTPCSEWTVNDLIGHIQGGAEGLAAKLSGSSPEGAQGGNDAAASYKTAVSRTLEAAKDPANLEKSVEAGGNEMPGGQVPVHHVPGSPRPLLGPSEGHRAGYGHGYFAGACLLWDVRSSNRPVQER
jgi:hypothetical protein